MMTSGNGAQYPNEMSARCQQSEAKKEFGLMIIPNQSALVLCPYCRQWAPTSEEQLRVRIHNVKKYAGVGFHACPRCGSADWVLSREMIEPEVPKLLKSWSLFFFGVVLSLVLGIVAVLIVLILRG